MITIVDYGIANLGSIKNMLRRIGAESQFATTPEGIYGASKLILPGIGSFDHGMEALNNLGVLDVLREKVTKQHVPILGVCLGAQLLGRGSEEGCKQGLGFLDAYCRRFVANKAGRISVPHMGWCHLEARRASPILEGLDKTARFYFVHSYRIVCSDPTDVLATAWNGIEFTAAVQRENIFGVQFHPEKSHRYGMRLLQNFVEI